MNEEKVICPECGNEVNSADDNCGNCGYPLKTTSSLNSKSTIKMVIGILLVVAGLICAFLSYRTRYMGYYDYYEICIDGWEDHLREYRDSKLDMLDLANSYNPGLFRDSYENLAESYQLLIDETEDTIDEYKDKQKDIAMKAAALLAASLTLVVAGGLVIKKAGR